MAAVRVMGIDTSLRSTGVAVVEGQGSSFKCVAQATLRVPSKAPHSECLAIIHDGLRAMISEAAPEAASIEGAFFGRNAQTAMILGEARGTAIVTCRLAGLPVFEYAPRKVKQALVGYGAAQKAQVRAMVMRMLGLSDEPQEDAGDALALAICHLNHRTSVAALQPKEI